MEKIIDFLPLRDIKVSSDDQPWCNEEVKKNKRLKEREYKKHRKSQNYLALNIKYENSIAKAKSTFYKNAIKYLKKIKTWTMVF